MKSREDIHLRDYIRVILKRKTTVLTVFVVLVSTVTISSFKMKPVFRATAQILIERETPNIVNIKEVIAVDASNTDYYQTQFEILKGKSLALRAIETLNLKDSIEFKPENKKSPSISSQNPSKNRISPDKEMNDLINSYLGKLKIEPIRNSRLVNISFEGYDPELITRIINTHSKLYIEENLERKLNASKEALTWINNRIKETKINLEGSEGALQKYREGNNLVSINFEERNNIIIQKLSDLNSALTVAKTKRIETENLYNELKRLSGDSRKIESLPAVVNNGLIQVLKSRYVQLMGEYSDFSQKFGSEHPRIVRLKSEISEVKDKIAQEIKNIAGSIEVEYKVSKAKEESIAKALEDQKETASRLSQKQIQYNVLNRDVETNRTLYQSLLTRAKETSVTEELKASNIMVVDQARVPDRPVKPRKAFNILLAIIVGLTLGVGLTFFLEYLDNTIKTSEEVERYLDLPTLGVIPYYKTK